jgi:hypothetical protein
VLKVIGFNACGDTSLQRNLFTKNLPVITNLVGDLTPCIGDTLIYRVQQSAVNHYDWTFPSGWTILSNEDSIAVRVSVGAQPGQVVVNGTNDCGDTTFISPINPVNIPVSTISVNNNILTINPPGQTYQWYLNSVPLTGAVQNPYTATQNGMYYARVTYSTGCIAYTDVVNVLISGLDYAVLNKVRVFPVPAQEVIHVEGVESGFDYKIYDLAGSIIITGQSYTGEISITTLMPGSYFIRIEKENRRYTYLFIKE